MTEQEKQWFAALTKDRAESADTLEKRSMRGLQNSVVDKYSDQAHFIYELLQNADDVKASSARFILEANGLYFIHNGSTRFSVSDPEKEEEDSISGKLGHINSITSIANSNKTEASIGKFGVGFKAVFQYTQTPHIYDPCFQFKIERFIVPQLLEADLKARDASDTIFWFPFDRQDKTKEDCYQEIHHKLKSLEMPTLFLTNLCSVLFEGSGFDGQYTKIVEASAQFDDITINEVNLTLKRDDEEKSSRLLTFARKSDYSHPYHIAYALENSGRLTPINRPAFCFFPTKEATNLNFVVQAPFLLTDSRESIKAGEKHNQDLVENLACLAADSLPVLRDRKLIDDGIFQIIPYDEDNFLDSDDRQKLSFKPFYTAIKEKLQNDCLLPALDGECAARNNAYWASDTELVNLFSDEQLSALTGNADARWILRSRGKKDIQGANRALANYIDGGVNRGNAYRKPNLIESSFDPEAMLKKINFDFIIAQSHEWLHRFYNYLSGRPHYQLIVKQRPIFLDEEGNAVAAFDDKQQLILFLPDDEIKGYTTVNTALLANEDTQEFMVKFGLKKPSLRDEIYNRILPAYNNEGGLDTNPHFKKFFQYFKECRHDEVEGFLELIRDKSFVRYKTSTDAKVYRGTPASLYLPTDELKGWFQAKPATRFVLLDEYREMVNKQDHDRLDEFFTRLGVKRSPRILSVNKRPASGSQQLTTSGHTHRFWDKTIDGCQELIEEITPERSMILWHFLSTSIDFTKLTGRHTWKYYGDKSESFQSSEQLRLRQSKWLMNNAAEFVSAEEVTIQSLSEQYDTSSPRAKSLIAFLDIRNEADLNAHLSEEDARKIKLADDLAQSGLSEDEIRSAIEEAKRKKSAKAASGTNSSDNSASEDSDFTVIQEIQQRRKTSQDSNSLQNNIAVEPANETEDTDDNSPTPLNFKRKLDQAKDRYASELDRIERIQTLDNKADSLPRYSYGWFLALLELEALATSNKNSDGKSISIGFGKVERELQPGRTLVFKEPSRFIPLSIEELSDVRVDLEFSDGSIRELRIESFTAKEFSLVGKLGSSEKLQGIEFDTVVEARIDIQNPAFLLQELKERFRELNFNEKFNMKDNLTSDIEFVFGPPGTGKTTYLAENVIVPKMRSNEDVHLLILTPTNKAADVLTNRIMDVMGSNKSYLEWLIRFGTSADDRIDEAGVWRDRSFDIDALSRSVTITTIARFAYDGFSGGRGRKLYEMNWDTIVVDEASMIPIANIIYPLHSKKSSKFVIAGDPFQIEPIVAVDQWKDENIYSLVGLNQPGSFAQPTTEPHAYTVVNLDTQYRSVPTIGDVFSRFTYNGNLKHSRQMQDQPLLLLDGLNLRSINLIKFPVSKYESIYRAKRLASGTAYQSYSAIFTFEFVRWMTENIIVDDSKTVRIGVIAPYRAQANLINKLIDSWANKPDGIEIQVGTIHGFQGDECDIIVTVFNPPPTISTDSRMFLNKQNILNVAISRARDYLFIIMPDSETAGMENLHKISSIETLVKETGDYNEYTSSAIEEMIWGNSFYLEENTFSTGHQMVNVYRRPERFYEVRSDDSAIDIQIHEQNLIDIDELLDAAFKM